MSVPFLPRAPMPPTQLFRAMFADRFFYIVYFQEPGVADADLARDPATTMRRLLAGLAGSGDPEEASKLDGRGFVERLPEPERLPDWLRQDELDHYVEEFARTGFTGGVNWYRNFDRNWELTPQLEGAKVEVPSLFVGGSLDPVLVMSPPSIMDGWLSDHRGTLIVEGAGHWVQQERPGEVNDALLGFLDGLDLRKD
jgi:pimeloyl-ACP methyl ester carboxylesterase